MEQGKSIEELTDEEWGELLKIRYPGYELVLPKVLDVLYHPGINTGLVVTVMQRLQEIPDPGIASHLVTLILRTRRLLLGGHRDVNQVNEMLAMDIPEWTRKLEFNLPTKELFEEGHEQLEISSKLVPEEFETLAKWILDNLPPGLQRVYDEQLAREREEDISEGADWDDPEDEQDIWGKGERSYE